jgi:hypothetical protein
MKKMFFLAIISLAVTHSFAQIRIKEQPWLFIGFPERSDAQTQVASSTFIGLHGIRPQLHILNVATLSPKADFNFVGFLAQYAVKLNNEVTLVNNLGPTFDKNFHFRSIRIIENFAQGRLAFRIIADEAKEKLNFLGVHGFYKPWLDTKKAKFLAFSFGFNTSFAASGRKVNPVVGIEALF